MSKKFAVSLEGTSPLLMHSDVLVDPLNPRKKEIKKITDKRTKKTDEDIALLYRLEWEAGLYYRDGIGPYIPMMNLRKMLIEGARKSKDGKQFEQGLFGLTDTPLQYDGPRDMSELWDDGRFSHTCTVGNQRNRVMRTRPRFDEWSVEFGVNVEPDLIDQSMLESALYHASLIGICDGRSVGYGRFRYDVEAVLGDHEAGHNRELVTA